MSSHDQKRYEITVDMDEDEDVVMQHEEGEFNDQVEDESFHRLKSAVTRKHGRAFSSAVIGGADNTVNRQDSELGPFDRMASSSGGNGTIAERSVEGWTIFITGLHEETTEDDLLDRLSDFGRVTDLKVILDHRTGYVKGYALVEFREYREAKSAVDGLDGTPLYDRPIKCDFAFTKTF